MSLTSLCEQFVRVRRHVDGFGHERRYMFNTTCPFTDTEGLRFSSITNNTFDYLNYEPTALHLFLSEPRLEAFGKYLDLMFNRSDDIIDWCYFKVLRKLAPNDFANLVAFLKEGTYKRKRADDDYRVPICLIPVIEFHALEDHSVYYSVKSSNTSLERTQLRQKINTYFVALMKLLDCTEEEILDVLVSKGVLPSKGFQLITTQKELTIALGRYKRSGNMKTRVANAVRFAESTFGFLKPSFGMPNLNMVQSLVEIFTSHPLYKTMQECLLVNTELVDGGRTRLANSIPNQTGKRMRRRLANSIPNQTGRIMRRGMRLNLLPALGPEKDLLLEAIKRTVPELLVFCSSEEK